uniref:Cnidarian restricted protein n=1 Tax=Clytia hemisphaerica TaxID=252671 RepID=A0A7M6DM41_9CNID
MMNFYLYSCFTLLYFATELTSSWVGLPLIVFEDQKSNAPEWPPYFTTEWIIYDTLVENPGPPFADQPNKTPFRAGHGWTYYDWERKSILELYDDFCLPIFDKDPDWRCHFLNTNETSFLISLDPSSPYPECCIFGRPWNAPAPNFASFLPYNSTNYDCVTNDTIDFFTHTGMTTLSTLLVMVFQATN